MPSEDQHEQVLQPVEWWRRPLEIIVNILIVALGGAPVGVVTQSQYAAAASGVVVLLLVNVAYWKYRGVSLSEVYDGLKPWV